jgi:hypothetical protein
MSPQLRHRVMKAIKVENTKPEVTLTAAGVPTEDSDPNLTIAQSSTSALKVRIWSGVAYGAVSRAEPDQIQELLAGLMAATLFSPRHATLASLQSPQICNT